jgi:FMN phosphatase YigB (HAD superfamily)
VSNEARSRTVFLFDVDNTLLDNDRVKALIDAGIRSALDARHSERFWALYEQVRADRDLVDLPETLERFGRECEDAASLGPLAEVIYRFDFAELLYPGALEALAHAGALGLTVILSDGDTLFQRHKIRTAGLEAAVDGRVLVYAHKERELDDIRARYPAVHYVLVDDKPRIHVAMKAALGAGVTTVLVEQGKYARDAEGGAVPEPDLRLASIAGFAELSAEALEAAARG